jgi:hypothetical protein
LQNFAFLLTPAPQAGQGRESRRGAPQLLQNSGSPETGALHPGHFRVRIIVFPQLRQNFGFPSIGALQFGQVLCPGIFTPQLTQNRIVERTSAPHVGHVTNFDVAELTLTIPVPGVVLSI